MKTDKLAIVVTGGLAIGCPAGSNGDGSMSGGIDSAASSTEGTEGGGTAEGSAEGNGPGNGPGPDDSSEGGNSDGNPKYDVGAGGANFCMDEAAGIYCFDNTAYECGDSGNEISSTICTPDVCLEGVGCVECTAGQFDCKGNAVYACNDAADPPVWEQTEVCDPAAGMGCDLALGACAPLQVLGGTTPTGTYYQFAYFANGNVFRGGYDVDSIDDKLYVASSMGGVDVYTVELLDSDGDGDLEPNQHPDNEEEPGEIEERVLTFVENIAYAGTAQSVAELYIDDDRFFIGGSSITEYVFASGAITPITTAPTWTYGSSGSFSQIGYDDVNGVWYASNEYARRVFQYCAETDTWGLAFLFPDLAGSHMDGMEVVTDPETGIPYVYVSDMTSDFIGQYEKHPDLGWQQKNLFSYAGTVGEAVEGMGFGVLNHFWATGGSGVYELGGGDLAEFTEPPG
jgi:hypothetical protein